jgi:hypothetical protein
MASHVSLLCPDVADGYPDRAWRSKLGLGAAVADRTPWPIILVVPALQSPDACAEHRRSDVSVDLILQRFFVFCGHRRKFGVAHVGQ